MKTFKHILMALACVISFSACEDFLDILQMGRLMVMKCFLPQKVLKMLSIELMLNYAAKHFTDKNSHSQP